ncbi:hypothetical protein [Actinomadura verrucosospora]|uniref:Uncharacterized protein n=1 Tax=Actinomadura verrucosospora TaxID=46165 RepID=A0A7D3ZPB0_ACTVE|nr:hypothetical protein [Actinomadura verrucosospora]QKG23222.1 hypothetical protein ACTIVE_4863 [Actinomadura verrucosospora]
MRELTVSRALVAAGIAAGVAALVPHQVTYDKGFAPPWATLAGAALAVAFALRGSAWTGRIAAVLLLWAGGGAVLDAFRAFFWATGIPAGEFAQVNWGGASMRAAGLLAAGLVVAMLARGAEGPWRERPWLGYAAFALAFPYPLLKLYWSLGGTVARPDPYTEGFPYMESVMLAGGAVLSLALVQDWGRRLPRRALLVPAWTATGALVSMGALAGFGSLSQALGLTDGPVDFGAPASVAMVGTVYGSWLLFGLALGGATLTYQRLTR